MRRRGPRNGPRTARSSSRGRSSPMAVARRASAVSSRRLPRSRTWVRIWSRSTVSISPCGSSTARPRRRSSIGMRGLRTSSSSGRIAPRTPACRRRGASSRRCWMRRAIASGCSTSSRIRCERSKPSRRSPTRASRSTAKRRGSGMPSGCRSWRMRPEAPSEATAGRPICSQRPPTTSRPPPISTPTRPRSPVGVTRLPPRSPTSRPRCAPTASGWRSTRRGSRRCANASRPFEACSESTGRRMRRWSPSWTARATRSRRSRPPTSAWPRSRPRSRRPPARSRRSPKL